MAVLAHLVGYIPLCTHLAWLTCFPEFVLFVLSVVFIQFGFHVKLRLTAKLLNSSYVPHKFTHSNTSVSAQHIDYNVLLIGKIIPHLHSSGFLQLFYVTVLFIKQDNKLIQCWKHRTKISVLTCFPDIGQIVWLMLWVITNTMIIHVKLLHCSSVCVSGNSSCVTMSLFWMPKDT